MTAEPMPTPAANAIDVPTARGSDAGLRGRRLVSRVVFIVLLVAATVGTRVLYEGAALTTYQWPLAVYVGLAIVVGIAPLAMFWRPMRIASPVRASNSSGSQR